MESSLTYSDSAEYKKMVIATTSARAPSLPRVLPAGEDGPPACTVVEYHSIGVGVTDVAASAAFYAKLGMIPVHVETSAECDDDGGAGGSAAADGGNTILRLSAPSGLLLDLVPATAGAPPPSDAAAALGGAPAPENVLMDVAGWKPPGHTHASWRVPSVPAVKTFFAEQGIPLSGTRSTLSVFVRDPDRTTLEFERNDGVDEPDAFTGARAIGYGRTLDHVGVRVRAPFERHLRWWARMMGFNALVHIYEPNPDPLKNFAP
jgi:catechol 2,3-dioxygenase-like lactoylglutathione lyase family enzyme